MTNVSSRNVRLGHDYTPKRARKCNTLQYPRRSPARRSRNHRTTRNTRNDVNLFAASVSSVPSVVSSLFAGKLKNLRATQTNRTLVVRSQGAGFSVDGSGRAAWLLNPELCTLDPFPTRGQA